MNFLDWFALKIINFTRHNSERIYLFFGLLIVLGALSRLLFIAAHTSAPPIDSGNQTSPAASPGQLAGVGNHLFENPLLERFRGCWHGVAILDSQKQLNTQWPAVKWSPENYRLCFVDRGSGIEPTLHTVNHIDSKDGNGVEKEQAVEFFRVEGATAVLRTSIVVGSPPPGKNTTHQKTTMRCDLADGPDALMRVSGDLVADVNGEPWRTARWHASFARADQPAERPTKNAAKPN
jgi:hypothetical protein